MKITVSPFTEADFPALSGTGYGAMPPEARRAMLAESERRTHNGRYFEVFTLKDGDTTVGFASLYEPEQGVVGVGLDIREPLRGRGYGTAASEAVGELLNEKGFSVVRNTVRADNAASIRLHEKLGFARAGQYTTDKGTEVFVFEKTVVIAL